MNNNTTQAESISSLTQWSFVSLFLFPVLPPPVVNVLFIVFSFLVVLSCILNRPQFVWSNIRHNALIGIPFIPYLAEYLTHTDNRVAGFELEKKLLFFIAPVVIGLFLSVYKIKNLRVYMYVFIAALFVLTVYSIGMLAYHNVLFSEYGFDNGARMLRRYFEEAANLYPTYYGLFATVAIVWLVYDFKNQATKGKAIYIIASGLLFFQELLLATKMPLIALIVSLFYVLYKTIEDKKKVTLLYACIIALFTIIVFVFPTVKNRVMRPDLLLKADPSEQSRIVDRVVILNCDKDIFTDNIWLGIGSRNAQIKLNECYSDKGYASAIPYVFNAHNQFLTLGINYGIFIMLIFITGIIYFIEINRKSPFALIFMGSLIMVMLTESILERQCGVYFYVLFFLILYNKPPQEV